jgi:hypothetical protein
MKLDLSVTVHRSYLRYIFTFYLVNLVITVPSQHDREEQRRPGGSAFDSCRRHEIYSLQKPLQRSAMVPSASWGIVFHYPG